MSKSVLEKLFSDLSLGPEKVPDLSSWRMLIKAIAEQQVELKQYQKEIDLGGLELFRLAELFQQKQQLLKSIFNASSDIIMTFDSHGQLIEHNHATEEILGVSAKELTGKSYSSFIQGGSLLEDMNKIFSSDHGDFRQSYFNQFKERELITNQSHTLILSVYASSVSTDKESFYPFYIRDITEQKKMQIELTESRALLGSFSKMSSLGEMAGSIAHEINTPLAVIQMRAGMARELLSKKEFDSETLFRCLTSIEQTTTKISSIVSGLRTFSRDSQSDSFVDFSIKQIIDDTFVLCTERFKINNIQIIRNDFVDRTLRCKPNQISQVLLNLLNNAFDAIEILDQRWINVDVQYLADSVVICVTDSGPGIPDEIKDKIMTSFFTTKEPGKGTGLGLSISQKLIQAHGGHLTLDASCPNTKFLIQLFFNNEVINA